MARLTIVVDIHDRDPGAKDLPLDAAGGVLHGDQPHELVSAHWGDMLPEPDDGLVPCVRPPCDAPEVDLGGGWPGPPDIVAPPVTRRGGAG